MVGLFPRLFNFEFQTYSNDTKSNTDRNSFGWPFNGGHCSENVL